MHNSALLNCRWGNLAARKSNAAMVVVEENGSFSTRLSCFSEFVFISISLLFFAHYMFIRTSKARMSRWPLRRRRAERLPPAALFAENLSKSFAGLGRTFPAV